MSRLWRTDTRTHGHTDTRTCESRAVFCWGRIRNIGEIIWLGMGNQLTWKAKSTFHKTMWDKSEFSIISEQLFQKNIICQIINIDLIHQEIIYDFKSLLISLLVSNSSGEIIKKNYWHAKSDLLLTNIWSSKITDGRSVRSSTIQALWGKLFRMSTWWRLNRWWWWWL